MLRALCLGPLDLISNKTRVGWVRLGDPGGEALFLLHFGPVFVLGGLRLGDPGGEALFLLHGLKSPFNNELSLAIGLSLA